MKKLCQMSDKDLALIAVKLLQTTTEVHIEAFIKIVRDMCKKSNHASSLEPIQPPNK